MQQYVYPMRRGKEMELGAVLFCCAKLTCGSDLIVWHEGTLPQAPCVVCSRYIQCCSVQLPPPE